MTVAVERDVPAETEERSSRGISPWGRTLRQLLRKRLALLSLPPASSISDAALRVSSSARSKVRTSAA